MTIRKFMQRNYQHFNAAVCVDAAEGWLKHLEGPGKMLVSLGGAMSTAELGISLAEMIRQDKVHAISCTGANLEEDLYNLVAHDHYVRIPHYRTLSAENELEIRKKGLNRVTDTCIPEELAIRRTAKDLIKLWQKAEKAGQAYFPHEYLYQLLEVPAVQKSFQIDTQDSWLWAAKEKNLQIVVPGWEDSSYGNIFAGCLIEGSLKSDKIIKTGLQYMVSLVAWYKEQSKKFKMGFFQIGGGISGDFPICAVPLIRQELGTEVPFWAYFCQISDSTTSYGSYSGAVPNEKITWEKLDPHSASYIIESDATIVAPLIFNYVLEDA